MAEPRIRRVQTQREFDTVVDDYVTQGYEIRNRGESSALVRKKAWGTGGMHALVFILTAWWTLGLGNVLYAAYAHVTADQVLVRLETGATESQAPAAASVVVDTTPTSSGGSLASALLALCLLTTLTACGDSGSSNTDADAVAPQTVEDPTDSGASGAAEAGSEQLAAAPATAPEPTEPEPTSEPEPTVEPTPSQPSFEDGTHAVGVDIQPGIYRNADVGGSCYWARMSGFSGDLDELIANDNASGSAIVEILETDAGFESSGCGTWVMDSSRVTESMTSFGEGTFMVGIDLEPGQYRNAGGGSCYWARLNDFKGSLDSIASNDNVDGQTIVDILPSDVGFSSSDCGTWEKVQ